MIVGTVVLCPALQGAEAYDRFAVATALRKAGVAVLSPDLPPARPQPAPEPPDDGRARQAYYVAQLAMAISAAGVQPPVLPVLSGDAGALAPAVALSQRAVRRAVAGYVLLDARYPVAGGDVADWPDAPVVYLAGPAAEATAVSHARLRDWRLTRLPDLDARRLAQALLDLLG